MGMQGNDEESSKICVVVFGAGAEKDGYWVGITNAQNEQGATNLIEEVKREFLGNSNKYPNILAITGGSGSLQNDDGNPPNASEILEAINQSLRIY